MNDKNERKLGGKNPGDMVRSMEKTKNQNHNSKKEGLGPNTKR